MFQKTNLGKRKIWHATIVAILGDNCGKILRSNLNGEHFEKINIKTAITHSIYSYAKLQSIWRIPDCGTKLGQQKE